MAKRAHSSGKLKGTKPPRRLTRKRFVALLESVGGDTLVSDFYETIEPLDKEVSELRAVADSLGKKLDQMIEQNENLHDRLMLALDGERPPKGILFTVEALAPFAAAAQRVQQFVPEDQDLFKWLGAGPIVTPKDLREAAKSYEHFIGKKQ